MLVLYKLPRYIILTLYQLFMSSNSSNPQGVPSSMPQPILKALQQKIFQLQKDLGLKEIQIERLESSNDESSKKIKILEDVAKLRDQAIKKLQVTVKQKEAIIIDKNQQIEQMNQLNPYWTDPVKASQLVEKIMQRSQNPGLSINKEDQDKLKKNNNKMKEAFSIMYNLFKQEVSCIPQAKLFADKNPTFYIQQPLKLVELYKLIIAKLKSPIPQTDNEASQIQKIKGLETKLLIYEKFAEDLKNALRYTSFGMSPKVSGQPKMIELKGLFMMKENLNKLFDIRYKEQQKFQEKKISNQETKLKEHLLNYIETIRGSVTTCIFNIEDSEEAMKKDLNQTKEKVEKKTKQQQGVIKGLKDKIRQGEILREREKFEYSALNRMNQIYMFNLKSILLIAHEEVKRLQSKVEELEQKQMKLKQILRL